MQVVDLTGETRRLAAGLLEAFVRCDERQRDEFLYYLLVRSFEPKLRAHEVCVAQSRAEVPTFLCCDKRQRDEFLYYMLVRFCDQAVDF